MATFTATITIVQTVEIECLDSKVKALLDDECKLITDYIETTFVGKAITYDVTIVDTDITIDEYSNICKGNGNEYEWDGESLVKL
jgi:hypothetical protein